LQQFVILKANDQIFYNLNFKQMKTQKMSLTNIQGKLSRTEMKNIMAGSALGECLNNPNYCRDVLHFGCCNAKAGYRCTPCNF
jgi:hypothetical protein